MFTRHAARAFSLSLLAPLLFVGTITHRDTTRSVPAATKVVSGTLSASPTATEVASSAALAHLDAPAPTPTVTATPTGIPVMAIMQDPLFQVRARRGGPVVRETPSEDGKPLSGLYFDTYLPVFAAKTDAHGNVWYQVRLWGALPGWIRADQTETGDPPPPTPVPSSPSTAAGSSPGRSAVLPLTAHGVTTDRVNFRTGSSVESDPIDVLDPNTPFTVQAWQTDDDASVWYRVVAEGRTGWLWSGAVELQTPRPSRVMVEGKPLWSALAGKGMWMPVPLLDMATPEAVVEAAQRLGLTHIYLEVGASGGGFYGRNDVDRLLPVAHRSGIKVIGWVLTGLNNLPSDVSLCATVASYRTASGDQLDGIAPDIEDNMGAVDVSAFSQILRAQVGVNRLIVGVIFPAGSWIGQKHPVAGTLSRSFNALAPMAYWHEDKETFSSDVVANYIRHAVVDIHEAVDDSHYPVAVIGQTYDSFSRNGAGPNNPTADEIGAALTAARDSGAVGVSLFQWGTTTPAEWDVLRGFSWISR